MSFHQFCRKHGVGRAEQEALAWHLAMMRAQATYEACKPYSNARLGPKDRP